MLKSKNTFYIARRTLGDNTLTFISYWNSPDISHPTYTDNFNKAKEFESRKQALEVLKSLTAKDTYVDEYQFYIMETEMVNMLSI